MTPYNYMHAKNILGLSVYNKNKRKEKKKTNEFQIINIIDLPLGCDHQKIIII